MPKHEKLFCCTAHSMARANLKKSEVFLTNTTTALKLLERL